jgi:hypothetical protein
MNASILSKVTPSELSNFIQQLADVLKDKNQDIRTVSHSKRLHAAAEALGMNNWHEVINNKVIKPEPVDCEPKTIDQYREILKNQKINSPAHNNSLDGLAVAIGFGNWKEVVHTYNPGQSFSPAIKSRINPYYYELILRGFDSSNDATDDLIVWVESRLTESEIATLMIRHKVYSLECVSPISRIELIDTGDLPLKEGIDMIITGDAEMNTLKNLIEIRLDDFCEH